jgi:hypothetical protein
MRGTYRASFLELLARSEAFFLACEGCEFGDDYNDYRDSANRQEMVRTKMRRGGAPSRRARRARILGHNTRPVYYVVHR